MQSKNTVTVSMGKPVTIPVLIPVIHDSTPSCINEPFMVNGRAYRVTCLSFGTPHGAVLVDDVDSVDVDSIGFALGTHPLFPRGADIVFAQILDKNQVKVRVWRRGKGEGGFSPESACVAAIVAMMLEKTMKHDHVHISMGGKLCAVRWERGRNKVYVTGKSEFVQSRDKAQLSKQPV